MTSRFDENEAVRGSGSELKRPTLTEERRSARDFWDSSGPRRWAEFFGSMMSSFLITLSDLAGRLRVETSIPSLRHLKQMSLSGMISFPVRVQLQERKSS